MDKKQKIIIIILIFLILILALSLIFLPRRKTDTPEPTQSPVFTPRPVITVPTLVPNPTAKPTQSPVPVKKLSKQDLINITPVVTNEFNIEYYSGTDSFLITIKLSPYDEKRALAEKWLTDRGLDLSSLKLEWTSFRNVE